MPGTIVLVTATLVTQTSIVSTVVIYPTATHRMATHHRTVIIPATIRTVPPSTGQQQQHPANLDVGYGIETPTAYQSLPDSSNVEGTYRLRLAVLCRIVGIDGDGCLCGGWSPGDWFGF